MKNLCGASMTDKLFSLKDAELFQQEAISNYEKFLAEKLVNTMRENERLMAIIENSGTIVLTKVDKPNKDTSHG
jgi:hypothetical protein